jgi:hypothetical protein
MFTGQAIAFGVFAFDFIHGADREMLARDPHEERLGRWARAASPPQPRR